MQYNLSTFFLPPAVARVLRLVQGTSEVGLDVNEPAWIARTLEHQTGKRMKWKLRSGQEELEGTVASVASPD